MKRSLLIAGGILAVLLLIIGIVPFLVPSSVYKSQIEQAATRALGRDVTVAGDVSLSIFPVISASVEDVTVANPDGFEEPNMIDAGALRGAVKILPLFSRRVEVRKLSFEDANVRLTRLEDGKVNWMLGAAESEDQAGEPGDSTGAFSASIDEAGLKNASLVYDDFQSGAHYAVTNLNFETAFTAPDRPLSAKASGTFQGQTFNAELTLNTPETFLSQSETIVDVVFNSALGNFRFDGTVVNATPFSIAGRFTVDAPRIASIPEFLSVALPYDLGPLGGIQANGTVSGDIPGLQIKFDRLAVSGDGLNASYTGTVDAADEIRLAGNSEVSIRNVKALSDEMGLNLDQLAPVQQLTMKSTVSGPVTALAFTAVEARTNSPTLSASYDGTATLGNPGQLDGRIKAESTQMKTLLGQLGIAPPEGDTLKRFDVSGNLKGTFEKMAISNGSYILDDTAATGDLGIDLRGQTPKIDAVLALGQIDLDPFLGTSSAPPPSDGWSDTPLDLKALKMLNADLELTADSVKIGDITLSNAALSAALENGVLRTDLNKFSTFGGAWNGNVVVDSSNVVPAVQFKLGASNVAAETLLGTLTGFDRLSGIGEFAVDVQADGASIKQIVNRLDGTVSLNLDEGALAGINLGQLVRSAASLSEAIASNNLDIASLGGLMSPQAETDFTQFEASLAINDGLAQIQDLVLASSVLDITGAGQFSLGGRTLDVKLTPSIDRTGQGNASTVQLNGIPVPVKVSGSWLSPKVSPDFSGVRAAMQAEARQRAGTAIGDRIGGELGSIVSGAIGGQARQAESQTAPSDEDVPDNEETVETGPEDDEDAPERVLRETLGSIFGPN